MGAFAAGPPSFECKRQIVANLAPLVALELLAGTEWISEAADIWHLVFQPPPMRPSRPLRYPESVCVEAEKPRKIEHYEVGHSVPGVVEQTSTVFGGGVRDPLPTEESVSGGNWEENELEYVYNLRWLCAGYSDRVRCKSWL